MCSGSQPCTEGVLGLWTPGLVASLLVEGPVLAGMRVPSVTSLLGLVPGVVHHPVPWLSLRQDSWPGTRFSQEFSGFSVWVLMFLGVREQPGPCCPWDVPQGTISGGSESPGPFLSPDLKSQHKPKDPGHTNQLLIA